MRLQLVLFFGIVLNLHSAGLHSQSTVSLRMHDVAVTDVIKEVEKQSDQTVFYNSTLLRGLDRVSVDMTDAQGMEVLNHVLRGTGLVCMVVDGYLVIRNQEGGASQQQPAGTVTGQVLGPDKKPMAGATVVTKNGRGVVTDANGRFSIRTSGANPVLTVSFMGMKTAEFTPVAGVEPVIVMEENPIDITPVVVMRGIDKEIITDAATVITGEELRMNQGSSFLQTLAILEPEFRIRDNNLSGSNPNRMQEINIRGQSTLLEINDINYYNTTNTLGESQGNYRLTEQFLRLNAPLFILDGVEISQERAMDLNQYEIDKVVILKDAGATSLYGSRGANGVIVITSIRPEAGKLSVTYRGGLKLQIPDLSTYDKLTAVEKLELEKDYEVLGGNGKKLWDDQMDEYERLMAIARSHPFDWLRAPVHTGVGQTHAVNMSGGNEMWRFRFDLRNDVTKGVLKGSERRNVNGTMSISYQTENFQATQSLYVGLNKYADSPYGDFSEYVNINPYYYPWDEFGEPVLDYKMITRPNSNYRILNPLYDALKGNKRDGKYTSVMSNTSLNYRVLPELSLSGTLGLNRQIASKRTLYVPSDSRYGARGGRLSTTDSNSDEWMVGLSANFNKTFMEKHVLTAGLSWQISEAINSDAAWSAEGFQLDNMVYPSMSTRYPADGSPTGGSTPVRRLSYLASLNYYYNERFMVDASFSRDGGSSYGRFSRYGTFWSVGTSYDIGKENFIRDNLRFVDNIRLRYNYGVSGNMTFSPEEALMFYGLNLTELYNGDFGYTLLQLGNPDLKWQMTYQHSLGAEFTLFNNRAQVTANYYNKLTKNAINTLDIPISHGFDKIQANIGTLRNTGWSVNLHVNILQSVGDGLNLGVNLRLASNKNTIVKLSDAFKKELQATFSLNSGVDLLRYREGHSMDAIYGLHSFGVDPATGLRWYRSIDGNMTLDPRPDDLIYLGDRQPKVNGTIGLFVYWKGFRLNANLQTKLGGMVLNGSELKAENINMAANLDRRVLKDVWKNPGDVARYKNQLVERATTANQMFVHRENMLSCGSINVEYRFPQHLVSRIGAKDISVGIDMADLFYLSSIRQERGLAYPFSHNPNFRLTLTF